MAEKFLKIFSDVLSRIDASVQKKMSGSAFALI